MNKQFFAGVGVTLAILALGGFLLGRGGLLGGTSGMFEVTPKVFQDTVEFQAEVSKSNCGTLSFTIPVLARNDDISAGNDHFTTTSVTVSGLALGDFVEVSVNTSTDPIEDIQITGQARSGAAIVQFENLNGAASTTAITTSTITACPTDNGEL